MVIVKLRSDLNKRYENEICYLCSMYNKSNFLMLVNVVPFRLLHCRPQPPQHSLLLFHPQQHLVIDLVYLKIRIRIKYSFSNQRQYERGYFGKL